MSDKSTNNILKPLTRAEASYTVLAKATYYMSTTEIYVPNKPYEKLLPGMETRRKASQGATSSSTSSKENLERSLRHTKKSIKEYIFSNSFDMFATFTFATDRQNMDKCRQKMSDWLKSQQKYHGKFEYLIVSELHKDGESIHFHALMQGFTGRIRQSLNPHTGQPLVQSKRKVFEFPGYTLGFTNVKMIEDTEESRIKTGFYVMKYITKDTPTFANKNRYWVSRGLKKPRTEDNPEEWYLAILPDHAYQTEYGTIYLFDNKRIEIFLP